jgi:hypothetical protein
MLGDESFFIMLIFCISLLNPKMISLQMMQFITQHQKNYDKLNKSTLKKVYHKFYPIFFLVKHYICSLYLLESRIDNFLNHKVYVLNKRIYQSGYLHLYSMTHFS